MTSVSFEGPVGIPEADLLEAGPEDRQAHNLFLVHELRGALDVGKLGEAARWVASRHESFRTAFVPAATGWRRLVYAYAASPFDLDVVDLTAAPDPEAAARAQVLALSRTPFDRAVPHLVRATLLRLAEDRFWFVSHCDHVALDGVAFATCLQEFLLGYVMLAGGQAPALPPARQPREHVAEVEALLAPVRAAPGPWREPYPADGFALRKDASRPGGPDAAGARAYVHLGDAAAIDALARAQGVSRSAPVVAAMALGVRAIAGRPDVALSLIRSGRRDAASRGVVGCLAWGDAWSARIEEDDPLAAVLGRADAFLRDTAPWRMLYIPTVAPPARRIVLNVNRYSTSLDLPGLTAMPRPDLTAEVVMWAAHDLLVQVFPLPDALHGVVRYRTSFFEPATIERFAATMSGALRAMVADPAAAVRSLG